MAKQKQELSPEVAARLADLAQEMRQILCQGDQGAEGGEDVLQLRADSLCNSDPRTAFWEHRATTRSGFHAACRDKTKQAA